MSFQALLFCPDEKTARAVTQVLSELDFAVVSCTEPFAAVKKLMGERFDAVVVDCENEQNATLLLKSARSAANNAGALAVAVVEGQAGVAKAFRIGANLVLTRPINIEQAKGTLRVARGLLRKNESAKPANAAPPVSAVSKPSPAPVKAAPTAPVPITGGAATAGAAQEAGQAASMKLVQPPSPASQPIVTAKEISAIPSAMPSSTGFAASAPAPARLKADVAAEEISADEKTPAKDSIDREERSTSGEPGAGATAAAPSFTFGGTMESGEESTASGGKKKLIAGIAAAALIAAASYGAWMKYGAAKDVASVPVDVEKRPAAPQSQAAQSQHPVTPTQIPATVSTANPANTVLAAAGQTTPSQGADTQTSSKTQKPDFSTKKTTADSSRRDEAGAVENDVTVTDLTHQPIMIKSGHAKEAGKAKETAAPDLNMSEIASSSGEAMPNLMGAGSAPTPVLQKLVVSQGVSRGLLIKQTAPVYPHSAIDLKIEGAVQLLAVVTKNGDIGEVKVLSGDKTLAGAAVEAVKKWKYKPYLLNGEPVDIQTQVTVNFKLPR